jgi:hypothetical protein
MPFDLHLSVLGTCFVCAWVFIGGMMVRESIDHARRLRFDPPSEPSPHTRDKLKAT